MEDLPLKLTMILCLFIIGILAILIPHQMNCFMQRILLANEDKLRKAPILGLFIRDVILLQEKPEGDLLLRIFGSTLIIMSVIVVFI